MKFTEIVKNEDNTYSIGYSSKFYDVFTPYYVKGSYHNILYRIFGLLPQDFYHMVGAQYKAKFKPSPIIHSHIYTLFENKADAVRFANEIDRRITYLFTKKEDFD